jgi:hypothetical protein
MNRAGREQPGEVVDERITVARRRRGAIGPPSADTTQPLPDDGALHPPRRDLDRLAPAKTLAC